MIMKCEMCGEECGELHTFKDEDKLPEHLMFYCVNCKEEL